MDDTEEMKQAKAIMEAHKIGDASESVRYLWEHVLTQEAYHAELAMLSMEPQGGFEGWRRRRLLELTRSSTRREKTE